ncbi:MAG: GerMN domain-containing protein, partial [Actinomycetia bacterium]|nr:GerMN domain-containing protein [Actinomycetes bacterium]
AINGFNFGYDARYPIAEVNSVIVDSDVITVDVDQDVWDPYPNIDCVACPPGELVMQQLVWTLHGALDTDLPVLLTVNGEPARGIWLHRLDGRVAADPALEPSSS